MTKDDIRVEDLFFMPCINFKDLATIEKTLRTDNLYEIYLAARHRTDYVPANVTLCYVTEVIPSTQNTTNPHMYNLHKIKVSKDDAHAIIELNFPEHEFNIIESNQRFNELILRSLVVGSQ